MLNTKETRVRNKPMIAVSSCLLGNNVRFNGANSHKKMITEELAFIFDYQPVCPEMSAGFGVPREPIYLELKENDNIVAMKHDQVTDVSAQLQQGVDKAASSLQDIDGFILKKSSPSCGNGSVKLYNDKHGIIHNKADGFFVAYVKKHCPLVPLEDEGRLNDSYLKEHFIKRVLLTRQAKNEVLHAQSINELMAFHTRHKIILRLHHPDAQKALGRLLANGHRQNFELVKKSYYEMFLMALQRVATRGKHHTILQRMLREINKLISKQERDDLQHKIKQYHLGILPLAVPVEIIKHYLTRYDIEFLAQQSYLNLYPESLGLMSKM
ncbi:MULTISPECIES: YbgA family protein [Cysteiniphilum]|uniref:DUF1722 domain-containing protein n=1 Tax=Cysteiniphilum litorale TaxID=2056700 RepID=A0A8J2Z6M1_9GAMM|nr:MULTISPECIES: DUF523 and DUF1722 domain-containing protein [Cysteiniphilum]GGG05675.1 hypothetical protein GCM10010995_23990 [Cysteiniphilum litorale]